MPCTSPGADSDVIADLRRELNLVTRLLCTVLGAIGGNVRENLCHVVPDLSDWYSAHLRADLIRKQREREAEERENLRQVAFNKLTVAERKALGLRE